MMLDNIAGKEREEKMHTVNREIRILLWRSIFRVSRTLPFFSPINYSKRMRLVRETWLHTFPRNCRKNTAIESIGHRVPVKRLD